jgi:hypothetical protein
MYVIISLITYFAVFNPVTAHFEELNSSLVNTVIDGNYAFYLFRQFLILLLLSTGLPIVMITFFPTKYNIVAKIIPLAFLPAILLDLVSDVGVVAFHFQPIYPKLIATLYWW